VNAEFWITVDEAAKHLGVAKDSVYCWIDSRALHAHRIGRLWKFKPCEFDDWVRAGTGQLDIARAHSTAGERGALPALGSSKEIATKYMRGD